MMRSPRRNRTKVGETGFSVIELMVVVVIMTAVLAASIPALVGHTQTINLKRGSDEVAGILKMARQRAVATNNLVIVEFDMNTGSFYAFEDADNDGVYDTGETRTGTIDMPKKVTLNSVSFTNGQVTFNPRGSASESGVVEVLNIRNLAQRVDLIRATGLVYISDVYEYGEETELGSGEE